MIDKTPLPDGHRCLNGQPHAWYHWTAYDSHVIEMGLSDGFRYHRQCSIMGCSAQQRVEDLIPTGALQLFEYK